MPTETLGLLDLLRRYHAGDMRYTKNAYTSKYGGRGCLIARSFVFWFSFTHMFHVAHTGVWVSCLPYNTAVCVQLRSLIGTENTGGLSQAVKSNYET